MAILPAAPPVMQFLQSLLLGSLLSLLYDLFYAIRSLFPQRAQPHVFLDILYFLLFGILLFNYLLMESAGRLRYFIAFGIVIGWILYHNTISRFIVYFLNKLISLLQRFLFLLLRPVLVVAKKVFDFIFSICKKLFYKRKTPKNRLKKSRLLLYNKVSKNSMEETGNEKASDHQANQPGFGSYHCISRAAHCGLFCKRPGTGCPNEKRAGRSTAARSQPTGRK